VSVDLVDPDVNATIRVAPRTAFGVAEADSACLPRRWTF
jgi:hypothetical protein